MTDVEKMKPETASEDENELSAGPTTESTEPATNSTTKTGTAKKSPRAKAGKDTGKEGSENQEPEKKEPEPETKETGTATGTAETDTVVNFSVTVSAEDIEKEFDEALDQYASEIKLPGFRKGKVPVEVIKGRYKDAIREEVIGKAVEKAVAEKIEADKLKIFSRPEVLKIDHEEGKTLTAEVRVSVFPTVEVPYLETIEVKIPADQLKVEDYEEQKHIDMFLEAHKRRVPVKREIKPGDFIMIKYQSKILQTKRMTPRKDAHFSVNEDESFEISDFYREIVGKAIDEQLIFKRTYPEDFPKKSWAGKEIEHYVTVINIFEWVKPELTPEFLKSIGFEDEENFKKKLKEEFEQVNRQHQEDTKLKHIIDTLCETIPFPVPAELVNNEVSRMAMRNQQRHPIDFKDKDQVKAYMDSLKADAEKSVRFSFIVDAIKEKFNLDVTADELEAQYKIMAENSHVPVKEVRKYYMNKENARDLKENLLQEKVLKLVKEKVQIKEV
jgi:trigger factor